MTGGLVRRGSLERVPRKRVPMWTASRAGVRRPQKLQQPEGPYPSSGREAPPTPWFWTVNLQTLTVE